MFLKKNTQILLIGFIWEEEARNILLTINRAKTNFGGGGGENVLLAQLPRWKKRSVYR